MKHCDTHHDQSVNGFTLLELLIVLTILVTVTSLSLPALRGALDKSRLTAAAKDVQAALGKARSLAIRESTPVRFRYEPGGQRFLIERQQESFTSAVVVMDSAGGLGESSTGLSAGVESVGTPADGNRGINDPANLVSADSDLANAITLREGTLPIGITFSTATNGRQAELSDTASALTLPGISSQNEGVTAATASGWSEPIVFHPSGRTTTQTLRLRGPRDFYVDVHLRGLTSAASHSDPQRETDVDETTEPGAPTADAVDQGAA